MSWRLFYANRARQAPGYDRSSITHQEMFMKVIERVGIIRQPKPANILVIALCCSIIIFSIGSFIYRGLLRGIYDTSPDIYLFYSSGQLWNEGQNPYNYDILRARFIQVGGEDKLISKIYYPPQAITLFALLARLPFQQANLIFICFNFFLLVLFLVMVAYILSRYRSVGLLETTLLISFANTIFGRMNIQQMSLPIAISLFGTFILSLRQRQVFSGILLSLTSIKPSFTPIFFLYYAFKRRYILVIVTIIAAGFLTTLPIILAHRPIIGTIIDWTHTAERVNDPSDINNPSPFEPQSAYLTDITPLIYRIFNAQSNITTAITWLIILALAGSILYLILRGNRSGKSELLDFSLISALGLVSVYHRAYDTFLLFPGLLYIYIHMVSHSNKKAQWRWASFFVLIMIILSVPGDLSATLSNKYPMLLDYYLWRVIAPFQTWASLAVLSVLIWMKARIAQQHNHDSTQLVQSA
jgi:hypothetical protein